MWELMDAPAAASGWLCLLDAIFLSFLFWKFPRSCIDSPSFAALFECLSHGAIRQPLSRCCNLNVNEAMMRSVGVDGRTSRGVRMALSFGRRFFVVVVLEDSPFLHLFLLFEERLSASRAHRSILT